MLNEQNYKNSAYFNRRSIRKYKAQKVEEWKVKALSEAFFQTQSSKNQMGSELIVIDDEKLLKDLRIAHKNARGLDSATLAFVITTVPNYQEVLEMPFRIQQDLGAATHQLCLMATDLGLGSVWCGIYPVSDIENSVKELLNIPTNVMAFSLICFGYADEQKEPNQKYFENKVHYNRW